MKRAKTLELPVADGLEVFYIATVEVLDWDVERHPACLSLAVGGGGEARGLSPPVR